MLGEQRCRGYRSHCGKFSRHDRVELLFLSTPDLKLQTGFHLKFLQARPFYGHLRKNGFLFIFLWILSLTVESQTLEWLQKRSNLSEAVDHGQHAASWPSWGGVKHTLGTKAWAQGLEIYNMGII
jgi:hypothetical protein